MSMRGGVKVLWSMAAAVALVVLTGCPDTGIVCRAGTERCGQGCIDPSSDKRNCGGCGIACGASQMCNIGTCECQAGTTNCGGTCVVPDYDAKNCGQCGVACAAGQVCEQKVCKDSCTIGQNLRCGTACVDPSSDVNHCGGCDTACAQGQSCRAGKCTYDVVAACYWSGQVVGFSASTATKGTLSELGSNPAALAAYGSTVLAADGTDRRLYQAVLKSGGGFDVVSRANATGAVPNQVLVDGTHVYVVNAQTGTLQVLEVGADGGVISLDAGVTGGVALGTIAELPFGMNSYPQGAAKLGDVLWVPLYGGFGAMAADAGQVVVKVSVAAPAMPQEMGRVSLKELDLKAFDGGAPVARPWAIAAHRGAVYVALNNLNPDTYAPEGPGLLARIDPANSQVRVIDLGASDCLNPQWVGSVGTKLAVSCGGLVTYSPSFTIDRIDAAGLVVLDENDARVGAWSAACPADAGVLADGGAACMPLMPGRFTVRGNRVLLGDQNGGRVAILDVTDAGIAEVRGAANAFNVCPVSPLSGAGNVSDVMTLP